MSGSPFLWVEGGFKWPMMGELRALCSNPEHPKNPSDCWKSNPSCWGALHQLLPVLSMPSHRSWFPEELEPEAGSVPEPHLWGSHP